MIWMLCQTFNDVFTILADNFAHRIAQQDALTLDPLDAGPVYRCTFLRGRWDATAACEPTATDMRKFARIRASVIARNSASGRTFRSGRLRTYPPLKVTVPQ
jgi:hypothetical protein